MIFVDTSAWFASLISKQKHYESARSWMLNNSERLVTTDYVLDETLTLLIARRENQFAVEFGKELWSGDLAALVLVSAVDVEQGWQVFQNYHDKQWSFTDCVSFAVMKRLDLTEAFTFDKHFSQFGFVNVVPAAP